MSEQKAYVDDKSLSHEHFGQDVDQVEKLNGEFVLALSPDGEKMVGTTSLKLAKDGRTILIPQPTDDPQDPMNWSSIKKHAALLLVAFGSFCGDFGAAAGIPAILVQAEEWGVSPNTANNPNNIAALMCGVAGLIWMPLLNAWGRAPVLFWSAVLGLFFTLGAILTQEFRTYYAFRCLQSLTQSTGQTIGLAFIEDCFFFHEHARKIGIWYTIFICSPFLSPMLGNFIIGTIGDWRIIFWLVFSCSGLLVCGMLIFGDETFYNRHVPVAEQPLRKQSFYHRLLRVTGIWQIQHHSGYFPTTFTSYRRLLDVFLKPTVPMIMLFYSGVFAWFVGMNISSSILLGLPRPLGGYGLSSIGVGYIYFTPIVGTVLGELFGHWFNDYLVHLYVGKHSGQFVPEVRLRMTYIGLFPMVAGLVLVGQTLYYRLNVVGIVFGWGMETVGVMLTSVAIVAYALDCYPTAPGEVSALINIARVGSGFSVSFYQQAWGAKQGYNVSFGLQAAVVAVVFSLVVVNQIFGSRLRAWAGPVRALHY